MASATLCGENMEFGELARTGAERLIRGDVERQLGANCLRKFRKIAGPHQPAGAQFVSHARRTE
jgi:hypothetical protein